MTANEEKLYRIIRNYDQVLKDLILASKRTGDNRVYLETGDMARLYGRIQAERTWTVKVRELIENPETAEEREESHEDQ